MFKLKTIIAAAALGLAVIAWFKFSDQAVDCLKLPKSEDAAVIRIENGQFDPKETSVNVCETVLFLNLDEKEAWPLSSEFDAGKPLKKFDYFQYQVTKQGGLSFKDKLNNDATGKINVKGIK